MSTRTTGPTLPVVHSTPAAKHALAGLAGRVGPLVVVISAGCCDGSAPMVLPAEDFPLGPGDVLVGEIDGLPVYVGLRELCAWRHPDFVIDVEPGDAEGLSLAPDADHHFVARSTRPAAVSGR